MDREVTDLLVEVVHYRLETRFHLRHILVVVFYFHLLVLFQLVFLRHVEPQVYLKIFVPRQLPQNEVVRHVKQTLNVVLEASLLLL